MLPDKAMVHTATAMFVGHSAATKHLLTYVIRVVLVLVGLFGDTNLFLTEQALELLSCSLLFLRFQ